MRIRRSDERGAALVHVTIALIALLALTSLTFDFGVKWVARGQAQNAADAGALAGAVAFSFDDPGDLTDTGLAKQSARRYAIANLVIGEPPDVNISTDVTFPPCPDGSTDTCIKVDVYRNQARQNPLPTFFASLVGVFDQGVRATATAQILSGNATECLRPWAVVDRWAEWVDPAASVSNFLPDSTFDAFRPVATGPQPRYEPDEYAPPTEGAAGTGWRLPDDLGKQFAIKTGAPGNAAVSSGWFRTLDLPRVDTGNLGGDAVEKNIVSCNGYPVNIASESQQCPAGSEISTFAEKVEWAAKGCVRVQTGVQQGPNEAGIKTLYYRDEHARWDPDKKMVVNSCCDPSPRVVPIAVMDIKEYLKQDPQGSGTSVKVVNIFGFFLEGMGDLDANGNPVFDPNNPFKPGSQVLIGRITKVPGIATAGAGVSEDASFLQTIILVR